MVRLCKCCQDQQIYDDNKKGLCSLCYEYLKLENRLDFYDNEKDIILEGINEW